VGIFLTIYDILLSLEVYFRSCVLVVSVRWISQLAVLSFMNVKMDIRIIIVNISIVPVRKGYVHGRELRIICLNNFDTHILGRYPLPYQCAVLDHSP